MRGVRRAHPRPDGVRVALGGRCFPLLPRPMPLRVADGTRGAEAERRLPDDLVLVPDGIRPLGHAGRGSNRSRGPWPGSIALRPPQTRMLSADRLGRRAGDTTTRGDDEPSWCPLRVDPNVD